MNFNSLIISLFYNYFDLIIGFIGTLPTLMSIVISIIQYVTQKDNENLKKIGTKKNIKTQIECLLVVVGIFIGLLYIKSTLVSMPRIEGMMYNDAIQTLNENGISYIEKNVKNPSDWRVSEQSTKINSVIRKKKKVKFSLEKVNNIDNNLGDVDKDGRITMSDSTSIFILSKENNTTKEQNSVADINHDNHITYIDAMITEGYCTYLRSTSSMSTSDKEIMSIEEYYVNKFDESEYSDN